MIEPNLPLTKELLFKQVEKKQHQVENTSHIELLPYFALNFLSSSLETENSLDRASLKLLGMISSLRLEIEDPISPYKGGFLVCYLEKFRIEDIPDSYLSVLAELIFEPIHLELKARIADFLRVKRYNPKESFKFAEISVRAYVDLFEHFKDTNNNWLLSIRQISRATQIAIELGRNSKITVFLVHRIEDEIYKIKIEDQERYTERLMRLLLQLRSNEKAEEFAIIAEKIASTAELNSNWSAAKVYWKLGADWYQTINNAEKALEFKLFVAETYYKHAKEAIAQKDRIPRYMMAAGYIQSAIEVLKNIPGAKQRLIELQIKLMEYQKLSVAELVPISVPFDPSRYQTEVKETFENKSLDEAIQYLISFPIPRKKELISVVKEEMNHFLKTLSSNSYINSDGKIIANDKNKKNILGQTDGEDVTQAYYYAKANRQLLITGTIEPARRQILCNHPILMSDLLFIVEDNPFIEQARVFAYLKGLHAGFHGDFITSIHLLIPQFEHSLRLLLEHNDILATSFKPGGIQEEKNLNSILSIGELNNILGEDIVFDLQGLFIERTGSNLRNRIAHGLMKDNEFFQSDVIYAWWIILKVCFLIKLNFIQSYNENNLNSEEH
ncbi:DUF4209 domain-containing protein [Paenibacillus amylolyticus]|nr:DUF4209 domain-containing protein [Paenibacillus amylolyticus]